MTSAEFNRRAKQMANGWKRGRRVKAFAPLSQPVEIDFCETTRLVPVAPINCLHLGSVFDTTPITIATETERRLEVEVPGAALALGQEHLEALITETAYDFYGQGTGDVLGPCTVRQETTGFVLSYQWYGTSQAATTVASASTNYRYYNNAVSSATTVLSNWLPSVTNWEGIDFAQNILAGQMMAPSLSFEKLQVVNKKAEALLLQHLTEMQRKTWLAGKYFDMQAPSGRKYQIKSGKYHNVFLLDNFGNKVREYCAYAKDPGGSLPDADNVFAQLLTLRFNEQEFLAHANTWTLIGKREFVGQGCDANVETQADRIIEQAA